MDLLPLVLGGTKIYQLTLPSGEQIPFKLLNWKEFVGYRDATIRGTIPQDILEASIFNECVLDPVIIDNAMELRAGVVPTVAGVIMSLSGPSRDVQVFNQQLDEARKFTDDAESQIIMIICKAFPTYTPEFLATLPWHTVMTRLAQAERILLSKDPPELKEPLKLYTPEEIEEKVNSTKKVNPDQLVKDAQNMGVSVGFSRDEQEADQRRELIRKERLRRVREHSRGR